MGRGKPFKPYAKNPDVAAVMEINGEALLELSEVPRRIPVQPGLSVPPGQFWSLHKSPGLFYQLEGSYCFRTTEAKQRFLQLRSISCLQSLTAGHCGLG